MSGPRTPGWIYVLASQSHPGIVKIGRTSRHTPGRMIEVDRSEYAAFGPWTEVWSRAVADCVHVEAAAHRMLANRRVALNRLGPVVNSRQERSIELQSGFAARGTAVSSGLVESNLAACRA